ncbi:guanylate cyclase [Legionella gratiana]|uniref:Guanylate cyclase n=1 Tax=Legionella gratiana TaxID=45066 RepID=A0A378J0K2_9GAMM|nr:adenylate/guanylate cyclase domain-containing protein [Legionella gratiana]KTD11631.1 guanylate cyclase [Legionella gratiana]STX41039.1 guanylate cyclase [Legionella gratiana]
MFILFLQGEQLSFLGRINGLIYDYLSKLSLHKKKEFPRVVIIDIDDYSVQREGRWPWPRDKMAILLNNLKILGVKIIAFDIVFSDIEKNYAQSLKEKIAQLPFAQKETQQQVMHLLSEIEPYVDNDQNFASTLSNNNAVLGYLLHYDAEVKKGSLPRPLLHQNGKPIDATNYIVPKFLGYNGILPLFLQASPHAGFVSNIPDLDGVIRHGSLLGNYANKLYANIALTAVMHYLSTDHVKLMTHVRHGQELLDGIVIKDIFIPTNHKGQILIPFWGLPGTIDYYSASDVIQNKLPRNALAGSIAVVGSTMVLLADLHQTPLSQTFPGAEVNANIITAILTQEVLVEFNWNTLKGILTISALGGILVILFPFCSPILLLLFYFFSLTVISGVSFLLFNYQHIFIAPAVIFLLTTLLAIINFSYDFILEKRQKNKIKELFGQYVPPSYVKRLTDFSENYSIEGETREMTVFFADIRDFTTLSEDLEAKEIKRLLNEFFTPITDIIFNHKGTIDKYVGDMIMAFWGAPLQDNEHCYHAISAALTINNNLEEINKKLLQMDLPYIRIGMGLATGLMDVGDMGSEFRRSYTVLGDTVNLASRLQDLTKYYQIPILVNESPQMKSTPFLWRLVDQITVKGRHIPLKIYEPLGYRQDAPPELLTELHEYEQGLTCYYAQDWEKAKEQFIKLLSRAPERHLYQIFLSRINDFSQKPPPKDWNGVFVHTQK